MQGSVTVSSGKRIAPLLTKVVGAWLTGTFDTDKSVSRAALDSFATAFPSEDKRKAVWRLYQGPLLDYVEDAVLSHTPQTLSDERSTSPDDAEAKYVRVVSTALLTLDKLLENDLDSKAISSNESLQAIFSAKRTWEFASHNDPSVRRAIYRLVANVVNRGMQLDWKLLSSCFIAKSLHIDQPGSSLQYIKALMALTTAHPSVWTTDYSAKTAVSRRLFQYLKQGSQRGQEAWWLHLRQLIKSIPIDTWSGATADSKDRPSYDEASQLLNALHEGVINSDEPRQNSAAAWSTYTDLLFWLLGLLKEDDNRFRLVQSFFYSIVDRFLLATPELAQWAVPTPMSLNICSSSINKLESTYPYTQFSAFYQNKVANLIELMKMSQPESSKNFKSSQDDIIQKARRFLDLQLAVEKNSTSKNGVEAGGPEPQQSSLEHTFIQSNIELVSEAVKLLRERNGKPYGAAGVVYIIFDKRPDTIEQIKGSSTPHILSDLLDKEAPRLLESPSAELLISILLKCRSKLDFKKSFNAILEGYLEKESLRNTNAYSTLLRGITNDDLAQHPDLEQQLLHDLDTALSGDESRWVVIYELLANQNINQWQRQHEQSKAQSIHSRVLEDMLSGLALDGKEDNALTGFDFILHRDQSLRPLLSSHLNVGTLLTRLLLLSDSDNEIKAAKAARLASAVKKVFAKQGENGTDASTVEILGRQLNGEGEALPIMSLVDLAREAFRDAPMNQLSEITSAMFPVTAHWEKALIPFLQLQAPSSVSLITPLQGCAFVVDRERRRSLGGLPRDSEGFSMALRLTILITKLLEDVSLERLTNEQIEALYKYYPQAVQVANDKLSIESANALWIDSTEEVIQEMTATVTTGQKFIHSWIRNEREQSGQGGRPTLVSCWLSQLSNIQGTSALVFNLARTFATIMSEASDVNGISRYMPEWDSSLREVRSSPDVMKSASLLAICRDTLATSALGKRLCNELVADATEIDFDDVNNGELSPCPMKAFQH